MSAIQHSVFEAAVRVAGETLYWKRSLKRILRSSGVSEKAVAQCEHLPKFQIFRTVWDRLDHAGENGLKVQKNLISQLANLESPEPQADQRAGRKALEELRRLSQAHGLLIDPDEFTRRTRQEERDQRIATNEIRERSLKQLEARLRELNQEENAQQRGYEFEKLLADLFRLYELEFKGSYKTGVDQIDGALTFDSFTYLVEARWRNQPAVESDLSQLSAKVERRIDSTRGIFISMAGFRSESVDLYRLSRGQRLIFIDGQDLALILEDRVELTDALREKIAAASMKGEPHLPLRDLL